MVKKILILIAAVVCCLAVVIGGVWCSAQCGSSLCDEVFVVVEDSTKRQFVDAEELIYFLDSKGFYPLGDSMCLVDCHAIEACLEEHEMVRSAECYKSPFGKVNISLQQRVPMPVIQIISRLHPVFLCWQFRPIQSFCYRFLFDGWRSYQLLQGL